MELTLALIEVFPQIIFIIGENTDHPFKNYVPNQIKFETFKSIPYVSFVIFFKFIIIFVLFKFQVIC